MLTEEERKERRRQVNKAYREKLKQKKKGDIPQEIIPEIIPEIPKEEPKEEYDEYTNEEFEKLINERALQLMKQKQDEKKEGLNLSGVVQKTNSLMSNPFIQAVSTQALQTAGALVIPVVISLIRGRMSSKDTRQLSQNTYTRNTPMQPENHTNTLADFTLPRF